MQGRCSYYALDMVNRKLKLGVEQNELEQKKLKGERERKREKKKTSKNL